MYTDTSDAQLLDYWRARRDADAFAELVARYGPLVYSACLRVLRSAHAAEDAAQDCFIDLIHSSARVRSLPAFLHTTATRRAVDRLRSERRRATRESCFAAEQPQVTDAVWDDVSRYVDEAIATLPAKQQRAVVLRFLHGRTYAAIAAETNLPPTTVQRHLTKGIEGIRQHLRRHGITASAGALGVMLAAAPSHALPASATAKLGGMALAGNATAAGGAGVFTLGGISAAKILLLTTAVALLGGLAMTTLRDALTEDSPPAADERTAAAPADALDTPAQEDSPNRPNPPVLSGALNQAKGIEISGTVVGADPFDALVEAVWDGGSTSTVSSGDGTFVLPLPRELLKGNRDVEIIVEASSTHFRSFPRAFTVPATGLSGIVLTSQVVAVLNGRVIDDNDEPLSGWTVRALCGDFSEETLTDADGKFSFRRLRPGDCTVTAHDAEMERHTTYNGSPLVLKPGNSLTPITVVWPERWRSLAGRVTDSSGQPIAEVTLQAWFDTALDGTGEMQQIAAKTDSDGRYVLTGFPERADLEAKIDLGRENYLPTIRYGIAINGQHEDFVLLRQPVIRGRVVDAKSGAPITHYRVGNFPGLDAGRGSSDMALMIITGSRRLEKQSDGTFSIMAGGYNTLRIAVAAPGYETAIKRLDNVAPGATVDNVEIRLLPAVPRSGVVIDEMGAPVYGARIYHGHPIALPNSNYTLPGSEGVTQTDELGRFTLNEYPPGLATISAYQEGFSVGSTAVKGNASLRITLTEASTTAVEGFITTNGAPVGEDRAGIAVGPVDTTTANSATTDDAGFYRTDAAPSGSVWISVNCGRAGLRRSLGRRVELVPGSTLRADFDFDDSGDAAIEGVLLLDGEPVPLAHLQASTTLANGDVLRYTTESRGDGSFILAPIVASEYEFGPIRILLRDGSSLMPDSEAVTVTAGETVVCDLLFVSR